MEGRNPSWDNGPGISPVPKEDVMRNSQRNMVAQWYLPLESCCGDHRVFLTFALPNSFHVVIGLIYFS